MQDINIFNPRSLFPDFNIPKEEIPIKGELSYEDKLRIAVKSLSQFADFHGVVEKLDKIQESERIKNDPVLQLLDKIKKFNDNNS